MKKIQNILLQKMHSDNLSHLITFQGQGNYEGTEKEVEHFVFELVSEFVGINSQEENFIGRLFNHPDVLIIGSDKKEETNYVAEELSEIYSFLNHKALQTKAKVIIIQNAGLLNDLHSNKLLKIFEKPPIAAYIFLVNPKGKKLLPTIESRSIKISLSFENKNDLHQQEQFISEMQKLSFAAFMEYVLDHNEFKEKAFYELLVFKMSEHCKSVEHAEVTTKLIKNLEKAFEFRLPIATRLSQAYFDAKKVLAF